MPKKKNKGIYQPRTTYKMTYRDPNTGREFTEEYDVHSEAIKQSVNRQKQGYQVSLFRLVESIWKRIF